MSSLCAKSEKSGTPTVSSDNPYIRPVATLLLRLVDNLEKEASTQKQSKKEVEASETNITKLLYQALKISDTLPDIREQVLKKLAYRASRQTAHTASSKSRGKIHSSSKNRKNTLTRENNKMQLAGASCVMKTSDVVKTVNTYINNDTPEDDFKAPDNFATDLSWIASALAVTDEVVKSSALLSCGNSITTHLQRNAFGHMQREDQLGIVLLAIRCVALSNPSDDQQIRLKSEIFPFLVEKMADLQIPILESFDELEINGALVGKYQPFEILLNYLDENSDNDHVTKYIVMGLDDVVKLYQFCLQQVDDATKLSGLNRKIANVYNEMGKKYIDSLILSSIAAGEDEADSMTTIQPCSQYETKALDVLQKACGIFESCNDVHNYALCEANMGRLYQVLSSCHKGSKELLLEEENNIKLSISHYRRAADVLTKDMVRLKESLMWDLVNVQLRLATLYQENPPLSRLSVKELERKLIDVLDAAEKNSNSILKSTDNTDRVHLRLAEINYRIAAMHHGHIVDSVCGKTLNHSIRLALRYYNQSETHFNSVPWGNQNQSWCLLHLRASIECMALIKNHKSDRNRQSLK